MFPCYRHCRCKHAAVHVTVLLLVVLMAPACTPRGDCVWSATGEAWLDANQNGEWDTDEIPLEGVKFYVDDVQNGFAKVAIGLSEQDGKGKINLWLPGCPKVRLEVYSEAPGDYALTTKERATAEFSQTDAVFAFGYTFTPLTAPTPTPAPDPISCQRFPTANLGSFRLPVAFSNDGVAWTTVGPDQRSMVELVPDSNEAKVHSRREDFLGQQYIYDMTLASDGAVWLTTMSGVTRSDLKSWTTFTKDNGMHADNAQEIAVLSSKDVLVETNAGIEVLDPPTIEWYVVLPVDVLGDRDRNRFRQVDDQVFLVDSSRILRFWKDSTDPRVQWEVFWEIGTIPSTPLVSISDASVTRDGEVWLSGIDAERRPVVLNLFQDLVQWTIYSYGSTGGAVGRHGLADVEVASDGSVWLLEGQALVHGRPVSTGRSTMRWVRYAASTLVEENDSAYIMRVAAAPDGTIWFATSYSWYRCSVATRNE